MGRSTYMVTWSTSWLTQAQPARVAASARRVLHVLRFYEALTELTTVSAALLAACDAPPSPRTRMHCPWWQTLQVRSSSARCCWGGARTMQIVQTMHRWQPPFHEVRWS